MRTRNNLLGVFAALALIVAAGAAAVGGPASAGDRGNKGNSGATITGDFDDRCTDFEADSNKDISYVLVRYADGSSKKFEGQELAQMDSDGDGTTFDLKGDKPISSVEVKSGTTRKTFTCPQCQDGKDNDGDAKTDHPNDPGCESEDDDDETGGGTPKPQCSDGVDNDNGGKTDFPDDPGCSSPQDNDEKSQCQDKKDNDGDQKVDYPADPGCDSLEDNDETDQGPAGNFTCRASALRVENSVLNGLLGDPFEPIVANADEDPCATDADAVLDETVAGAPGSLSVEVLSAETNEAGTANATTAEVVIRDAAGNVVVSATALEAEAAAACDGGNATTTGSSRVASVTLPNGTTITPDDGEHIDVELPIGTLHINHVETTSSGDEQQTTVRSLWLDTNTPLGDVIVAEAIADVHGDPC